LFFDVALSASFLGITPAACARELDVTSALLATLVVLAFAAAVSGSH